MIAVTKTHLALYGQARLKALSILLLTAPPWMHWSQLLLSNNDFTLPDDLHFGNGILAHIESIFAYNLFLLALTVIFGFLNES